MRGLFAALLLAAATASVAQEGFPLDGTWRSESTAKDGSHRTIVLVMQWDGKSVTGTINPGPKGIDFTGGTLNPDGWKFTLDVKNAKLHTPKAAPNPKLNVLLRGEAASFSTIYASV